MRFCTAFLRLHLRSLCFFFPRLTLLKFLCKLCTHISFQTSSKAPAGALPYCVG
jgi:hypothetical protein